MGEVRLFSGVEEYIGTINAGIMTPNEARRMAGLDRIRVTFLNGSDEYYWI